MTFVCDTFKKMCLPFNWSNFVYWLDFLLVACITQVRNLRFTLDACISLVYLVPTVLLM